MSGQNHLFAAVLLEPEGRLVRHVEVYTAARDKLIVMGLFDPPKGEAAPTLTLKGRLAHWIACEMNPRRAFRRTEGELEEMARFHEPGSRRSYAPRTPSPAAGSSPLSTS